MRGPSVGTPQHLCEPSAGRTLVAGDVETSIDERFMAQVVAHGPCLAIGDGDRAVTYAELADWASRVAARLRAVGVRPGTRVVLLLDQGAPAIAATLGVLRAGAVYVPLDRAEPHERLGRLIARIRPDAFLTDDAGGQWLDRLGVDRPVIMAHDPGAPAPWAPPASPPDAPASIFFTSGSTGTPKGVVDCHRNIIHNAWRYTVALDLTPDDRLSLVQPPASSATMSSTFAALLNGAALVPYRLDAGSIATLVDRLRDQRVTVYHSVPSILRRALAFGGELPDVRVVRLEGDRAHAQEMATWRRAFRPGTVIANGLGTTETGLCRQLRVPVDVDLDDGIMPVGYPVEDMDVAIVDGAGEPVPAGATGEIAVTSRYLAMGYLDDDAQTAAAFRPAPGTPGQRTYRTGDLGRLRQDGCLEYLGRRDGSVKVLGHLVEPAEVEAALATIPGVRAVAVRVVDGARGEGRVSAWVVADPDVDERALRVAAAALLPPWMRPARYIRTDALPVASTGKVDRRALEEPPEESLAEDPGGSPARTAAPDGLEARVGAIMRRILGRPIGPDDDFFEMGGDSLGAVDVLLALEAETGRRLPASIVLEAPSAILMVAALAVQAPGPRHTLARVGGAAGGVPLVLVPGHFGNPLAYAALAHRLAGVRPVLAADASIPTGDDIADGFEGIARRHVEALRGMPLQGPYLLGGHCFGAAVAYEMARLLHDSGEGPAGLYLLGISPYDLPDLVPHGTEARWHRSRTPMGRVGSALRSPGEFVGPSGMRFAVDGLRDMARAGRELTTSSGRERRRRRARQLAMMRALPGRYRGPALPLPVSVVVSSWSVAAYTTEARVMWQGIGSSVEVHVVPGAGRMMLREPVVARVARIMASDPPW